MKKLLLLLFLFPVSVLAQVADDFSDGDFTQNPAWSGTMDKFLINSNLQLQLNAMEAGSAHLSLPVAAFQEMEWHFWIREAFAPSGNNFTDVWVCADNADLTQATQGYFVRFGEGGNNDAIELFRKDANGQQSVCRGTNGAIATAFSVAVKVNCDSEGHWTVMTCFNNAETYSLEAEGIDDTYEPPAITQVEVIDNQNLALTFNEALDEISALNVANFSVDNGIGNPLQVGFGPSASQLHLNFANVFANGVNYILTVRNISDLSGNVMEDETASFSIFEAAPNDVVINEIMADPTPVVDLPEWEFVELFNTTNLSVDLKDWTLTIGTATKTFGACSIEPNGYLIVCHQSAIDDFSDYGATIGLLTSTTAITNGGTTIRLANAQGNVISEVAFDPNWYHDPSKTEGGWSLEQIDPLAPCAGANNWAASVDAQGGTPGRRNSVDGVNDATPKVERVSMIGDDVVQIWFDQRMDLESLSETSNYFVDELGEHPQQVEVNLYDPRFVALHFSQRFAEGVVYNLTINNLNNCIGLSIEADTRVQFGIPKAIAEGDIVINELLFDPIAPGVDYVELYNNSSNTFDLSTLMLGVVRESFPNPPDTTLKEISAESRLFLPQTYVLLSSNSEIVGRQYDCPTGNFVQMASFPSYPNAGATVVLKNKDGMVVDAMSYTEKMHYPLLKVTKGVSLERVAFDHASMDANNWHSAAENAGFGTPGQPNSMKQSVEPSHDEIAISPETFSPDGDGFDDACFINYRFDQPGYTMNVYVFNVAGQLVRHLAKGEMVGQEGSVIWNGLDDKGNRVPVGVYVILTEVFNFEGTVKKFKNAAVVSTR